MTQRAQRDEDLREDYYYCRPSALIPKFHLSQREKGLFFTVAIFSCYTHVELYHFFLALAFSDDIIFSYIISMVIRMAIWVSPQVQSRLNLNSYWIGGAK